MIFEQHTWLTKQIQCWKFRCVLAAHLLAFADCYMQVPGKNSVVQLPCLPRNYVNSSVIKKSRKSNFNVKQPFDPSAFHNALRQQCNNAVTNSKLFDTLTVLWLLILKAKPRTIQKHLNHDNTSKINPRKITLFNKITKATPMHLLSSLTQNSK